jgi:hypothetical protein
LAVRRWGSKVLPKTDNAEEKTTGKGTSFTRADLVW